MDPKLVSNQVFAGIQPATMEDIKANSVILYSNRYTANGEIPCQDSDLEELLNSTIGMAGNNVLVQLRKKMSMFKKGPWYIDSIDGVVYIHNRREYQDIPYNYTYSAENGEVLYVSFRIQEVFKPLAGIASTINALNKTLIDAKAEIQALLDKRLKGDYELFESDKEDKWNAFLASKGLSPNQHLSQDQLNILKSEFSSVGRVTNLFSDHTDSKEAYDQYEASSAKEKVAYNKKADEINYLSDNLDEAYSQILENSDVGIAQHKYQTLVSAYGESDPRTKKAKEEFEEVFKKTMVVRQSSGNQTAYSYYTDTVTETFSYDVNLFGKDKPSPERYEFYFEANYNSHLSKMVRDWRAKNIDKRIVNYKVISISSFYTFDNWTGQDVSDPMWLVSKTYTVKIKYWGLGSTYLLHGDRVWNDYQDRYGGVSLNSIPNLMANSGRRLKEKQLVASIRVIGNPQIEAGHKLNIYNVGKKHSGLWYITKVSHILEYGQGYTTDIELSKKPPTKGDISTSVVHTQAYTVDNESADIGKVEATRSGLGTTSSQSRPKANVVKGNTEYTYEDAFNEPYSYEDLLYFQQVAENSDPVDVNKNVIDAAYRIADVRYYERTKGVGSTTSKSYVTSHRSGSNILLKTHPEHPGINKFRTNVNGTQQIEVIMNYLNKNKQ